MKNAIVYVFFPIPRIVICRVVTPVAWRARVSGPILRAGARASQVRKYAEDALPCCDYSRRSTRVYFTVASYLLIDNFTSMTRVAGTALKGDVMVL